METVTEQNLSRTGDDFDPANFFTGVVHIHTEVSHDGHGGLEEMSARLRADGIDFCVLTDHFEDLDADSFGEYLAEIRQVNLRRETVFVPGVEAEIKGFHVLLLPVASYDEVRDVVDQTDLAGRGPRLKILAHPAKHDLAAVTELLRENAFDGVEIWNQHSDGNYLPPLEFLDDLVEALPADMSCVVFGSDVHDIRHRISNLVLIPRGEELTPTLILDRLRQGRFLNFNRNTALSLPGDSRPAEIAAWLAEVRQRLGRKALLVGRVKKVLRFCYHLLPRSAQHRINDFKNAIKNRL